MTHEKNVAVSASVETLPVDNVRSTTFSAARQTDFRAVIGF